jgi:predicted ATPase/class 3 adenylate cyclase
LFTDLEGSTRLLEAHPAAYREAVRRHHDLLRAAVEAHGGAVFETVGDAVYAAFAQATDAVAAALAGQLALQAADWGELGPGALRARMGLHTGEVERQGAHYFGAPLYRGARLTATAHGGQTVLSEAAAALVRDTLPELSAGAALRDLGEHRLKDLQRPERIFQVVRPDLPADFPPLRTLDARPHNLPVLRDPLIGRARELAQVEALLARDDVGLVTLTGPGGVGKTRLALQAAADLLDRFPDGVVVSDLAPVRDPALVAPTVVQTLGVPAAGGRPPGEVLRGYLRERRLLLLLDNFEQVLGAAALVADLLRACPHLKALVTSREALRLGGERRVAVPPLALPDPRDLREGAAPPTARLARSEAVRLFVARAQAVDAQFALTAANATAVAAICARLDGLPLALELAAARVRILAPAALLARLEHRLGLLTGGARDAPARQRTLRAALDWSYDLLSVEEQTLFRRLGVFAGGFTLEAVAEVCATPPGRPLDALDALDSLDSLVAKSLARPVEAAGAEPRFAVLESVREYALELLTAGGEEPAARRRHAAYYLALAERAEPALAGPDQGSWLDRLEQEHDNLRAALAWASEGGTMEAALRLAGALWPFWDLRGHFTEGRRWLAAALRRPGPARPAWRAKALHGAGALAWDQEDYGAARPLLEEALAVERASGNRRGIAAALDRLGDVARHQRDYELARSLCEQSLALCRELGDRPGTAAALTNLANVARRQGDQGRAQAFYEQSLAVSREVGDRRGIGWALNGLGLVASARGEDRRARAHYEASLVAFREVDDRRGIASLLLTNAWHVAQPQGDYARARALCEESLALSRELGDRRGVGFAQARLAQIAAARGDAALARSLYEQCLAILRETGDQASTAWTLADLANLARRQGDQRSAGARYRQSLAVFRQLGDARGLGWSLCGLGWVAQHHEAAAPGRSSTEASRGTPADRRRGAAQPAAALFREALGVLRACGDRRGIAHSLAGLAAVAVAEGRPVPAARLLGAVEAALDALGSSIQAEDRADCERAAAAARALLDDAAYAAARAAGEAMSLEQAVADALAEDAGDG